MMKNCVNKFRLIILANKCFSYLFWPKSWLKRLAYIKVKQWQWKKKLCFQTLHVNICFHVRSEEYLGRLSNAILHISYAVKQYNKIKLVSLPWRHHLGPYNLFFFMPHPGFKKICADVQTWDHHSGALGECTMHDEDLEDFVWCCNSGVGCS